MGEILGPLLCLQRDLRNLMGHVPVLASAAVDLLVQSPDGLYIDATIGCGSHARAILGRLSPRGRLWGFDWDQEMLEVARKELASDEERIRLFAEPFSRIGIRLSEASLRADGILADLGLNSAVLDQRDRGFRYLDRDAPLDMRMDRRRSRTAADLLRDLSEEELADLFKSLGEVRRSRAAARAIVRARDAQPLSRTGDLLTALRKGRVGGGPGELSRIWQALRLKVNDELEDLDRLLSGLPDWLAPGGRFVAISYESLSDRRVKGLGRPAGATGVPPLHPLHRRVIRPDREEIRRNPRGRSAKLRGFERMVGDA